MISIISYTVSGKLSKSIPLKCLCSPRDNEGNGLNVTVVDRLESSHNLILVNLLQLVYVPPKPRGRNQLTATPRLGRKAIPRCGSPLLYSDKKINSSFEYSK